jgi:hypothetical protein
MSHLFGRGGIQLTFLRVPIGASDITKDATPYSYDDVPHGQSDQSLSRFSVAHVAQLAEASQPNQTPKSPTIEEVGPDRLDLELSLQRACADRRRPVLVDRRIGLERLREDLERARRGPRARSARRGGSCSPSGRQSSNQKHISTG